MRGRKPHPTAVRLLRGNPSRRPVNTAEPEHAPVDPAVPAELVEPAAIAEWQRLIVTLSRGHCTTVDRGALVAYCVAYGRWQRLESEAAAAPSVVTGRNGTVTANPILGLASKALGVVIKAAAELGFTPSSRSRVVALPPSGTPRALPGDEFTAFQRRRFAGKADG